MSACYYVNLKINVRDEAGMIKALQEKIANAEEDHVNYSLDEHAQEGVGTDTLDDLMKIFLAGWKMCDFEKVVSAEGNIIQYTNGFNASYGWEGVMMDMFEIMTPYLYDNSKFTIDIDNDYDSFVVENGKCVTKH